MAFVRRLKPGERVPDGAPRRYPRPDKDVVALRWQTAPGVFVETDEHRVIDGTVTPPVQSRDVPAERIRAAVDAAGPGDSLEDVAARLGVSRFYLRKQMRRYDITWERRPVGPKRPRPRWRTAA